MSIIYRSSLLFSQPTNSTISKIDVQNVLYHHKKKLEINQRSSCIDNNYKTQKLSARQVKTIQNLSQRTRKYSLNTLLQNYHKNLQIEENELFEKKISLNGFNGKNSSKVSNQLPNNFKTIDFTKNQQKPFICPQKLKLFKSGVDYRSKQRVKGTGIRKINIEDLKTYFERSPQEEINFKEESKSSILERSKTISYPYTQRKFQTSFKFNRIHSYKSCVK